MPIINNGAVSPKACAIPIMVPVNIPGRAAGNTWVKVINTLRPRYAIGLSATPYRSDGLTAVLFQIVGPHPVSIQHSESAPKKVSRNEPF